MFVHDAVLEAIICGETDITTNKYEMKLQKLKKVDPVTGCSGLKSQFNLLFQVTPNPDDVLCDTARTHPEKNRSNNYLLCEEMKINIRYSKLLIAEKFLVPLQESNSYINASFIAVSTLLIIFMINKLL